MPKGTSHGEAAAGLRAGVINELQAGRIRYQSGMVPFKDSRSMPLPENKDDRWFEDYATGDVYEFGPVVVEEADILDFGRRFDPQPFHTDPAIGAASPFGGLTASGWHVCAVMMRLLVDGLISRTASLGSPGVEQIRWVKPVRPGDALRCRLKITSTRRLRSRPERGIIAMDIAVLNQESEVVMTCSGTGLYRTRPAQLETAACGCS